MQIATQTGHGEFGPVEAVANAQVERDVAVVDVVGQSLVLVAGILDQVAVVRVERGAVELRQHPGGPYYEMITKRMPGAVLRKHGVVTKDGDSYTLTPDITEMSPPERAELMRLCDEAIETYKAKRGATLWEHRAVGLGQIPGRLRYDT